MPSLGFIIKPFTENHKSHESDVESIQKAMWPSSDNECVANELEDSINKSKLI